MLLYCAICHERNALIYQSNLANYTTMHIITSPYNFSIQNCPQNSDRVQLRIQSPKWCILKHLKNKKLHSVESLKTEMMSDPSNYHKEYSPYGTHSLFQFEGSDVMSVPKISIEYSSVFFKCLFRLQYCIPYL